MWRVVYGAELGLSCGMIGGALRGARRWLWSTVRVGLVVTRAVASPRNTVADIAVVE